MKVYSNDTLTLDDLLRDAKIHIGQLECIIKELNRRGGSENLASMARCYPLVSDLLSAPPKPSVEAAEIRRQAFDDALAIASTKTSEYAQAADREIAAGNDSVARAWELWLKGAVGVRNAIERGRDAAPTPPEKDSEDEATGG